MPGVREVSVKLSSGTRLAIEPVAHTAYAHEITRLAVLRLDLLPQVRDVRVDDTLDAVGSFHTVSSSCWRLSSRPRLRTKVASSLNSTGVISITAPARRTSPRAKSTSVSPKR